MQLKKGCEAEYKKRHDALWPELKSLLFQHGIDFHYIEYVDIFLKKLLLLNVYTLKIFIKSVDL